MGKPLVQVVDEYDKPIGAATYEDIWTKGLTHQIVRIMVEDPQGRILLQKRLTDRELYPGRWDNSAAGHVDEGENYETAAKRELKEEIGITGFPLQEMGYYKTDEKFEWRKLHHYNKAYKIIVPKDTKFAIQKDEVADLQWFTVAEVHKMIKQNPDNFTDGTIEVLKRLY